ncbi:MAG: hypothetical protein V4469_01650 [Patescibacteria group bacterium]
MQFLKTLRFNLGVMFVAIVLMALVGTYPADAVDSTQRVIGYSWSSNVGWISFNDGTVSLTDDGSLVGYAWSSNIGWVKFGGLTGFPNSSLGGNAKIDGTKLTGWARAVSVMNPLIYKTIDNRGGWDGWISLNSNGNAPAYGVALNGNVFSGFAWGSDVVGWMDWSKVKVTASDQLCTSANGLLVEGETTTISTKIASGADKGKCQTQDYLCKSQNLTAVGAPSAPVACQAGLDCETRDGVALKDGEAHKFYKQRLIAEGQCESENITCTAGVLVGPDGVADDSYMYTQCLKAPNYKETQ